MQLPRLSGWPQYVRTMMILVLISAVILTLCGLVHRAVDPLLKDRAGTLPVRWIDRGMTRYIAVVALGTAVAATPFVIAIVLALKTPPRGRTWRRKAVRWLGVAISLACGLAILDYPLDGLRLAWLLRDGTGVAFYHQYRNLARSPHHALSRTGDTGQDVPFPTRSTGIVSTRGGRPCGPTPSRPLSGLSITQKQGTGAAGCGVRSIARLAPSSAREDPSRPA